MKIPQRFKYKSMIISVFFLVFFPLFSSCSNKTISPPPEKTPLYKVFKDDVITIAPIMIKNNKENYINLGLSIKLTGGWYIYSPSTLIDDHQMVSLNFFNIPHLEKSGALQFREPIVKTDTIFNTRIEYFKDRVEFIQKFIPEKSNPRLYPMGIAEIKFSICNDIICIPGRTINIELDFATLKENHVEDRGAKLYVSQNLKSTMIKSGENLEGFLLLKNIGNLTLKIRGIDSSCGCTTLRLKNRTLPPQSEIRLFFKTDTTGKTGRIEKTITIHSNDMDSPWIERISFHAVRSEGDKIEMTKIFQPPCAKCHIDAADGIKEAALFKAICEMCHSLEHVKSKNKEFLTSVISFGNEQNGMPAYKDYLSLEQIYSLAEYMTGTD